MQATGALFVVNVLFITLAFNLAFIGTLPLLLLILALATILSGLLYFNVERKKAQKASLT